MQLTRRTSQASKSEWCLSLLDIDGCRPPCALAVRLPLSTNLLAGSIATVLVCTREGQNPPTPAHWTAPNRMPPPMVRGPDSGSVADGTRAHTKTLQFPPKEHSPSGPQAQTDRFAEEKIVNYTHAAIAERSRTQPFHVLKRELVLSFYYHLIVTNTVNPMNLWFLDWQYIQHPAPKV